MVGTTDARAPASSAEECAIVLAPLGCDALVLTRTLAVGKIACLTSESLADLIERVRAGAGVLVVTEEALSPAGTTELLAVMGEQPSWSDLPIVLLLASDEGGAREAGVVGVLRLALTVTVLQRPVAAVTVLTAVQASLRARRRQYEVRDLLASERRAREQAEAATRIKDEFLATVSHELRTPVSAILLWAQLFEAGRLSAERLTQAMHAITASAAALCRLIEDLLDVSRMLMGKLRIDVQPQSLRPILRAAIEVVRPMADAKGVRLDLLLDASDELVLVDADRVQQILWNLLCNAVKFTGAGGAVSLRLAHAYDRVTVTVSDTGQGIGPELLPHVFERFRQVDGRSSRRQGGLGLGLAIVQQLVELHGGTIDVESPGCGQGSTFTVRLPLAPAGSR